MKPLTYDDHNSTKEPRKYVYPVVSRRAGGLSIGINLNPGKECNWACVYCEVDGLVRGKPKGIDLATLEAELDEVLMEAIDGRLPLPEALQVPTASPRAWIKDISLAGDGEPTLSPSFQDAVDTAIRVRSRHGLESSCRLVVITNGSRVEQRDVAAGLQALSAAGGEIWFKLDTGDPELRAQLNGVQGGLERVPEALTAATRMVPTWVQTMAVHPLADPEGVARVVVEAMGLGAQPRGILLYGLRRPSRQPGGEALRALTEDELRDAAEILGARTGLPVRTFA